MKISNAQFISRAKEIHGDRYSYTNCIYIAMRQLVTIDCILHGAFNVVARNHLAGSGCKKCLYAKFRADYSQGAFFVSKAKQVHGDRYNYDSVDYKNKRTACSIKCPDHGIFEQMPYHHLRGHGCPQCSYDKTSQRRKMTKQVFIQRAKSLHGDLYLYEDIGYVSALIPCKIICRTHGCFKQVPAIHLRGSGCPKCSHAIGLLNTPKMLERSAYFYIIKLFDNTETMYKVGFTTNKRPRIRFNCISNESGYAVEIVHLISTTVRAAFNEEQRILSVYALYSYSPKKSFRGDTECLRELPTMII